MPPVAVDIKAGFSPVGTVAAFTAYHKTSDQNKGNKNGYLLFHCPKLAKQIIFSIVCKKMLLYAGFSWQYVNNYFNPKPAYRHLFR